VNTNNSFFSLKLYDWSERPLTDKMVLYGAKDTHYSTFIAHKLVQEAKEEGVLEEIWDKSDDLCKSLYEKERNIASAQKIIKAKTKELGTINPASHEVSLQIIFCGYLVFTYINHASGYVMIHVLTIILLVVI